MARQTSENIELGRFEFDTSAIVKGAQEIKKSIDEIKEDQKILKKNNQTSSRAFVENEVALKALNSEYRNHIKALQQSAKDTQESAIRNEKLDLVLNQEVRSIREAREQNKLLNQLRNEANLTTAEGVAEVELLNQALDRNNEFIKENVDAYTQQKINIGNYEQSITNALEGNKALAGTFQVLQGGLGGVIQGVVGFTRASLAFIATPVGAVIAVLAGAFLLVQNALNRSEEATNKLSSAFAPFKGILNAILDALEPVGEFLIEGIVAGLEFAVEAVHQAIDAFASLAEFLGFEEFAEGVRDFNSELRESADQARELEKAEQALTQAQREARLVQLQYTKDAEKLRQERDDISRSIEDRIRANDELGRVLDQQLQKELELAQTALTVAELRIEQEGRTKEALDAQFEALTEIADIEERITGQRSEQLTEENALRQEAIDKANELAEARIKELEDEIKLFEAKQGFRAKSTAEELDQARETARIQQQIFDEQLENKLISEAEYNASSLQLKNDLAEQEANLLAENAQREIDELRRRNEAKRLEELYLTEQIAMQRKADNNAELFEEQLLAEQKLQNGLISQQEFDDQIRELREANRIANEEIDAEREALKKEEELELRALEFEAELERLREEGATRAEIEREIAEENKALELQANQEAFDNQLISEEVFLARRNNINDKFNQAEAQRDQILRDQKLSNIQSYLGRAGALIDQESIAGKAIALSGVAISTYRGIAKELEKGFPASIPGIALVSATGIKSALDITKTKVPSATGRGNAGGGGGGGGLALSNAPNLSGSGVNLTELGSENGVVQNQIENLDGGRQAEAIGDAVREGSAEGTSQGAQEGITQAGENTEIQNASGL